VIEYHNDILGIEVDYLVDKGIFPSYESLKKLAQRGKIKRLRVGGNGRKALVEYDSMDAALKQKVEEKIGRSPYEFERYGYFKKYIVDDAEARTFFSHYVLDDGRYLTDKNRLEYYTNAIVLNAVVQFVKDVKELRSSKGNPGRGGVWKNLSKIVNELASEYRHTLPAREGSLRNKATDYAKNSYESLISGKIGSKNAQKRNEDLDSLILSLYVTESKPFEEDVWHAYNRFLAGDTELYDKETGELITPEQFKRNGEPLTVSISTVRNILNEYRADADKMRNDYLYYNGKHRPHHHRKSPEYSLSKLSLDDRDLPPLLTNGGKVKAYFVWDVASELIVGYAFSTDKNQALFVESIQSSFRTLVKHGLGMPMEVEVEHHLVKEFKTELETLFPFVRWSAPGNAQEKRAENFNKKFKYQYEKKLFPTGRFYAKMEANRPKVTKIWDKEGMQEKHKRYTFKELTEIYVRLIEEYNNDAHSAIPGKTRLQVFTEHANPNAKSLPMPIISKSFGFRTETSLRRNQYVRVQYNNYMLPSPAMLDRINQTKELTAYWLPNADDTINEVHLYQQDDFICTCAQLEKYNESRAEQTELDLEHQLTQQKYVAQYDARIKVHKTKVKKIGVLERPEHEISENTDDLIYIPKNKTPDFDLDSDFESDFESIDYSKLVRDRM